MSEWADLTQASRDVDALLVEFGQGEAWRVSYSVSTALWNHGDGVDRIIVSIYIGLDPAFRREAATLAGALGQVRSELVARFGEPA